MSTPPKDAPKFKLTATGREKLPCKICGQRFRKGDPKEWDRTGRKVGEPHRHRVCANMPDGVQQELMRLAAAAAQSQLPLPAASLNEQRSPRSTDSTDGTLNADDPRSALIHYVSNLTVASTVTFGAGGEVTIAFP
jgi:hypothetical protein